MKKSKIITTLIGLIIFIYLIYIIGLDKIISTFRSFNLFYFPLAFIILLISNFLAGLNIWVLIKNLNKISFFECIKYNFFTIFYSTFMPGKLADFFIIYYFKEHKIKISESSAVIFFDKSISLILKAMLGIFGALFLLKKIDLVFFGIPLLLILLVLFSFVLLFSKRFRNLIRRRILKKHSYLFKGFFKNIKTYLNKHKKELFYNFLITVIKVILETLLIYTLFLAFGLKVNFLVVLLVFNLLTIINFVALPVGITGLGLKESLGIIIFGLAGIDRAVVLNSYIIKIILIYLVNLLVFLKYSGELNLLKKSKLFKKKIKFLFRN